MSVPLLTSADHRLCSVHCPASANRLRMHSPPDREVWRVLFTTDVLGNRATAPGAPDHQTAHETDQMGQEAP